MNLKKTEKTIQRTQERKEHMHRSYERLKTKTVEEIEDFQGHFDALQSASGTLVIDVPKLPAGLGLTSRSPTKRTIDGSKPHGRSNRVMITDRERPDTAPPEHDRETSLENDVNKAYWVVAKTRMDLQRQTDRRNQLYEAFERIKTETRVNSLDELLATYVGEEDLNFEMFGAISELNQELEELETQRSDLQSNFKKLEKASLEQGRAIAVIEGDTRQDLQRTKKLKQKKEDEFEVNKAQVMKHEEALKNLVQVLTTLDEDDNPIVDMLIKNGLTLNNVDTFLAFIEDKISEINTVSPSDRLGQSHAGHIFADGTRPQSLRKPTPPDSALLDNDPSFDSGPGPGPGTEEDAVHLAPLDLFVLKAEIFRGDTEEDTAQRTQERAHSRATAASPFQQAKDKGVRKDVAIMALTI
jgi:hypothetical protein